MTWLPWLLVALTAVVAVWGFWRCEAELSARRLAFLRYGRHEEESP